MRNDWQELAGKGISAASDAASETGPGPRPDALRASLDAAAKLLERGTSAAVPPLVEAMRLATELAADGDLALVGMQPIALAFNACLGAAHVARLPGLPPTVAVLRPLLASTAPSTRAVEREFFTQNASWPALVDPVDPEDDLDAATEAPETGAVANDVPEDFRDSDDDINDEGARVAAEVKAWERPPIAEWRDEDGVRPPVPPVRLEKALLPVAIDVFYENIVSQILDELGTRARARAIAPLADRADTEASILRLVDALLAVSRRCAPQTVAWWHRSLELDDPFVTWAAVFALASIEGADALIAVRAGLEQLSPGAVAHAVAAADALALAPHPERRILAADLCTSPHPLERAVGVALFGREGALSVHDIQRHLFDANLAVMGAAIGACARLSIDEVSPLLPLLERRLLLPDPSIAWLASRELLRRDRSRPCELAREGGRFLQTLGGQALEIFVLAGSADDLPRVKSIFTRTTVSAATLSALARFGHPACWAVLLHYLGDDDLADAAADAIEELFGPRVAERDRLSAPAWRSAITELKLDPSARYRRGQPWRPSVVAAECCSGQLSQRGAQRRLDELAARTAIVERVDLGAWMPGLGAELTALERAAQRAASPASGWR